jgi:ribose transport system substrate-binding protein
MPEDLKKPYIVQSVVHAAELLRAFQSRGEVLRLRDLVERTGFNKGLCFRLLHTLRHCGFIEKVDEARYRLTADLRRQKRYRIGFAGQGLDSSFAREVQTSLLWSGRNEDIELITVDNRYNPKIALRNAEHLVRERVDLVIESQSDEAVAGAIGARFVEAGIPFIAVDIPHPGGTYFGANNYQAGLLAGHYLGRWARNRWNGQVDSVILLEMARAGSLMQARMNGVLSGLKETLREAMDSVPVVTLDGDGQFKMGLERIRKHLRQSNAKHVLVAAANDSSALGAARAFQEAGRAATCAIVGHNGEPDMRTELRQPRTPLIGTVGFFPERYGEELIKLALDLLAHRATPPAVFMRHQLLTPANLEKFYPHDVMMGAAATASWQG